MTKHRTQLFLEQEQYESLAAIAKGQQSSISEVVRDFIDLGLEEKQGEKRRRLETLEELAAIRERMAERLMAKTGLPFLAEDPIAAVRAEREEQTDAVLRGKQR